MNKINRKIFSLLWLQIHDGTYFGSKIINKLDIGLASDYDVPVIWIKNDQLGAKILAFLITSNGKAEEFVYLFYQGKKDTLGRTIDRKFFGRVRGGQYASAFIFSLDTLSALNSGDMNLTSSCINQTMAELKKTATFDLVAKCIKSRPFRQTDRCTKVSDTTSKSVRAMAGGLYGLGKNRKH